MWEYVSGKNSVQDAIDNNLDIAVIYTTKPNEIKNKQIKVISTTKDKLDKMVSTNHQGFVAQLKEFNYFSIDTIFHDKPQKILILDHVQDPRNLGAIVRTANAAGIKHIVIPNNRAAKMTAVAAKVSSGGYVGMKIIRTSSLMDLIQKLKKNDFWIYASGFENAKPLKDTRFNYPMAMIVGNEGKGVSKALLKHSDQTVLIPMQGTVQSLNVSVAAGILLFAM